MSNSITAQLQDADSETGRMGVASPPSKRRLQAASDADGYPIAPKHAKKSSFDQNDPQYSIFANGLDKCSSEFLTTSILARTLLTSSSGPCTNPLASSPLESLKSSLEALPTPMFLESLEELQHSSPFSSLISDPDHAVTVLSPVDHSSEWDSEGILVVKGGSTPVLATGDHQVITEDENGKSYFNLGPSEATVLAKKSSSSSKSSPSNSPPDQTWTTNSNSLDYLDESSSSSSCESISSEDLFNSCGEYDEASEDEEDVRSYKQQRSTVLHLSLCKLNSFRNQQCAEPSLHRSVLICNTLRHIEQEIRREDELKKNETFLHSRETLPSFWSTPRNPPPVSSGPVSLPITNTTCGQDPYLSSSLYESPYSTAPASNPYDYNNPLRPQTPFHTPSYNYPETESQQASPTPLSFPSSPVPSLMECDSGYGEDAELSISSYYYSASSIKSTEASGESYLAGSSETAYSCNLAATIEPSGTDKNKSRKKAEAEISRNESDWSKVGTATAISSFAQQESQCGMESLRSDLFLTSTNSIHHQLPMDSLISSNYSST